MGMLPFLLSLSWIFFLPASSRFPQTNPVCCWATLGAISVGRTAAGTDPFLSSPGLLLLGHPSPTVPQPWHFGSYVLSKAPERVLLHKGHMVSSKALQDLLGLSPKPSGGPDWEGTPLAGSMLELEAVFPRLSLGRWASRRAEQWLVPGPRVPCGRSKGQGEPSGRVRLPPAMSRPSQWLPHWPAGCMWPGR